jgi:hypothetical protein
MRAPTLYAGDTMLLVCDRRYRHGKLSLLHEPLIAAFRRETFPAEVHFRIMEGLRSQGARYDAARLIEFVFPNSSGRNRVHRIFLRLSRDGTLRDAVGHRVWMERAQ